MFFKHISLVHLNECNIFQCTCKSTIKASRSILNMEHGIIDLNNIYKLLGSQRIFTTVGGLIVRQSNESKS